MRLNFVRSREQGGLWPWVARPASTLESVDLFPWPRLLKGTFGSSTNSSRGKATASTFGAEGGAPASTSESSYLVDPASSHMLVSKIKPCMSKYKQICTVKLRMAH